MQPVGNRWKRVLGDFMHVPLVLLLHSLGVISLDYQSLIAPIIGAIYDAASGDIGGVSIWLGTFPETYLEAVKSRREHVLKGWK